MDCLLYNLCSSDGYVCQLNNGEILMDNFDKLGEAWVWRYRENTKKLVEAGANPPDLAVKYGKELGIKVAPVVRMNDIHDVFFKYEASQFKMDHPETLIGYGSYNDFEKGAAGHPEQMSWDSFTWSAFNYACEGAREHKFKIIEEFITRWDNDGISLDFEREPRFFKELGSKENADIMTELVREARVLLDKVAAKRRKPQFLHVRVLPDIQAAYDRGLDVRRWVEEDLVDAVSPGAGYMTMSADITPWLELVENQNCWIYPSNNHWKTPEETRAWAKWMYQQGAHGLYFFNWGHLLFGFDKHTNPNSEKLGTVWMDEVHPCYYQSLSEIGELRDIEYKDSVYKMESWARGMGDGGYGAGDIQRFFWAADAIELPIELSVGEHIMHVPFAEDVDGAKAKAYTPKVTLRLKLENYTVPDKFDVAINGKPLDAAARRERAVFIMNNDTWIEYPVETDLLKRGQNELKLTVHSTNPQMSVVPVLQNVELVVRYVGA